MATKLKNMKLTSVDLVRAGANQEADICLFKSADPPEAPESPTEEEKNIFKRFIDWIRKNPAEAATEPPGPIEKTDEAPDLEYLYKSALADSLYSIMQDETLTEIEKKDMAEESLSQYSEKIRELNGEEDEEAMEEEVQEEEPDEDERFDELEEVHKFNQHHGADGKFTSGGGGGGNAAAKRKIFQQAAAGKFSNRTEPSGPEYSGSKSEIFRQAAAASAAGGGGGLSDKAKEIISAGGFDKAYKLADLVGEMKLGDTVTCKDYKKGDIMEFKKVGNADTIGAFQNVRGRNHMASPQQVKGWVRDSVTYAKYDPSFKEGSN